MMNQTPYPLGGCQSASQTERVDLADWQVVMNHVMLRLPSEMRAAITLRNRDRRTFAEIGEELQVSSEAARRLWARGIEQLRNELLMSHEFN
jgi:RNA polymerase sigma factor (sigma-70 family)